MTYGFRAAKLFPMGVRNFLAFVHKRKRLGDGDCGKHGRWVVDNGRGAAHCVCV